MGAPNTVYPCGYRLGWQGVRGSTGELAMRLRLWGPRWTLRRSGASCLEGIRMSFVKHYTSVDELKDESLMVLVGRAISHTSTRSQPSNMPWTISEIDVE